MADRKHPKGPKGPKDPHQEPDEPDYERPQHKPEGRDHQVHKEILERRNRGGKEPTPDVYRRALEQWKNLPGSIIRPPTDISPEEPSDNSKGPGPSKPDTDKQNN